LRRGLSKDPDARFPSMHELIDEIARIAAPRPPWLAPAAMAAVITSVAAAAIVMVVTRDDREACTDASERLAGIWDESTRATVETAVRKHEGVLGAETWTSLAPILDTYASSWTEQRNEACRATHVRHEESEEVWALRIACLDRRLQSLRAVVDVLAEGDLAVVTNAVEAAERLPALDHCVDGQRLQQETPPPPPEIAGSVGAVEAKLVRAATFRLAAQYDEALAIARSAVDDAVALGYGPTVSAARTELSRSLINVGLLDDGRDQLVDAFFAARQVHDEWRAAEAATELVACTSGKQFHLKEGALWARHAELSLQAAGDPAVPRFRYLRELADLRRNEGHPREATEIQREALGLLASVQDADSLQYALGQAAYARGLAELGRLDEALANFDLALAGIRARLGHTHPRAADMLAAKAVTRMRNHEIDLARAELEEALRYYRAVLGQDHPSIASTMGSLAGTYPEKDPTAVQMLEQVVAQQKRILPEEHPDIAISEVTLGSRLVKIGRTEDGIAILREALARLEGVYGPRHPNVGAAHHNLGVAYFGAKRLDDARLHMSIALEIDRDRLDRSHPGFVAATSNVAFLDMLLERYAEAIPLLVESLELQALRPNRDLPREVSLASALVRAYVETGQLDLADAALQRGYALAEQVEQRSAKSSLDAERAAVLWARGEKRKALDLALELRAELDPEDAVDRDDTIPVLDARIAKWRKELEGG
jgi:tetratricopeptide (TPR) repeat protein